MNNIKAIIFDWDNTLFDFQYYWEIAHKKVFEEYEFNKCHIDYKNFMTIYKKYDMKLWQDLLEKKITLDELRVERIKLTLKHYKVDFSEQESMEFFNRLFHILLNQIEPNYQLIENIKKLKKKYKMVILTNGKSSEQNQKIKFANFEGLLPVYISEDIGAEKPNLKAFKYVIKELDFEPNEILMIGDSLCNDIYPSKQLGMMTMYIGDKKVYQADYVFNDIMKATSFLSEKLL